jgi:hypothetical protein
LLGVGAMAHLLWRSAGGTDRVAQAAAIVAVAALLAGVAVELWRGPRER